MDNTVIRVIEPFNPKILQEDAKVPKLRVAAYARVSTEQDEQQNSYEAQVNYYTQFIKNCPTWTLVDIYADEGISGTSTKQREGFNRMIADAKAGKIDLILTKSISRFARNTVDTLNTVRELQRLGIEVRFEKENINTLDKQSEVILTIMSSLAQEESRSISENVKWGHQRSMQQGKVSIPYDRFLGYKKGEDGKPMIDEEQAAIVREIYDKFLDGVSIQAIAQMLTERKIPTPCGKEKWAVSTVNSILSNEKYKGDCLRQKTYTADYLTKDVRKNNGDRRQYYIENSHPAIIDEETFELAQIERAKRSKIGRKWRSNSPLSNLIICGDCGEYFGHKILRKGREVWYCNKRYEGARCCSSPIVNEKDVVALYRKAVDIILHEKGDVIHRCEARIDELGDLSVLQHARRQAEQAFAELTGELQRLVDKNARVTQNQEDYREKYAELADKANTKKLEIAELRQRERDAIAERGKLKRFVTTLKELKRNEELPLSYAPRLLDCITVSKKKVISFHFKNGQTISLRIA